MAPSLPILPLLLQRSQTTGALLALELLTVERFEPQHLQTLASYGHLFSRLRIKLSLDSLLSPSLVEFLTTLTNLKTLNVVRGYPSVIQEALGYIPSALVVLNIESLDLAPGQHVTADYLVDLLDHAALYQLKRFRLGGDRLSGALSSDGASWLAKLEARGIDVRDNRRFFTGACARGIS